MATTIVPKFNWPIHMTMEEVRDLAQEMLESAQGDCDKADEVENSIWYQGRVDALSDLLFTMTFPRHEDDARECIHANMVWFGHECGICESEGYKWAETS